MSASLPPLSELKKALRAAWPGRRFHRIRVVESGWANLVLEADDRIVFRIPRRREVAKSLDFEIRALELLSHYLTIPIPRPELLSTLRRPEGWPFMAYPKLTGIPLSGAPPIGPTGIRRLGEFLGTLLTELESVPPRSMLRIGAQPGSRGEWEKRYRRLFRRFAKVAEPAIEPRSRRAVSTSFGRFFDALRGAHYRPIATHLDLGVYNILWDKASNRPTGVIDWEDARLADPAFDLTGLMILGPANLRALTDSRMTPEDSTFERRLAFYRQMVPLHDFVNAAEIRNSSMMRKYAAQLNARFQE